MTLELVTPSIQYLGAYTEALQRGWGPSTTHPEESAKIHLGWVRDAPERFLELLNHKEERGLRELPDGTKVFQLPGFERWIWDGEFSGSIEFRWCPGTASLPDHAMGHIGYSVVSWKQRRGYATKALGMLLDEIKSYKGRGLSYVEITTDIGNAPSEHVILNNGGIALGAFTRPASYFHTKGLRFRIDL